jgi:hypothetical protein
LVVPSILCPIFVQYLCQWSTTCSEVLHTRLYGDDSKLYSHFQSDSTKATIEINDDLVRIRNWCLVNSLLLNSKNCSASSGAEVCRSCALDHSKVLLDHCIWIVIVVHSSLIIMLLLKLLYLILSLIFFALSWKIATPLARARGRTPQLHLTCLVSLLNDVMWVSGLPEAHSCWIFHGLKPPAVKDLFITVQSAYGTH